MSDLQKSIVRELEKSGVNEDILSTVMVLLEGRYMNLFGGLESIHRQTRFFKDNFSLLVCLQ